MNQGTGESHRTRHDPSTRPRHAVTTSLGEVVGIEPTELRTAMYESVELEALDTLLLHERETDLSVTFVFEGKRITVWRDEEAHVVVTVENADAVPESATSE